MAPDRINLLLLPYAGGSAGIYREWRSMLPAWIEPVALTLPGRGTRHGEPLLHEWSTLLDLLAREVRVHLDRPFAIFGHSLGALVALELTHTIRAEFDRTPIWLGVSGCKAPSQRDVELKWLECPEEEFLEELRSLSGTPPELLENRELLDLVLPVLRADFHLAGSYRRPPHPPLSMPMLILGGTQDEEVAVPPENLSAWNEETTAASHIEMIDAGHFYINTHQKVVVRAIEQDLVRLNPGKERKYA